MYIYTAAAKSVNGAENFLALVWFRLNQDNEKPSVSSPWVGQRLLGYLCEILSFTDWEAEWCCEAQVAAQPASCRAARSCWALTCWRAGHVSGARAGSPYGLSQRAWRRPFTRPGWADGSPGSGGRGSGRRPSAPPGRWCWPTRWRTAESWREVSCRHRAVGRDGSVLRLREVDPRRWTFPPRPSELPRRPVGSRTAEWPWRWRQGQVRARKNLVFWTELLGTSWILLYNKEGFAEYTENVEGKKKTKNKRTAKENVCSNW